MPRAFRQRDQQVCGTETETCPACPKNSKEATRLVGIERGRQ